MKVEELVGSVLTHEVLMYSKHKPSEEPKGRRTMALKVNSDDEENFEESTDEIEDDDDKIEMLSGRIKTLIRKKKNFPFNNNDKKKVDPTYAVFGESSDADQEEQHEAQLSLRNEEYQNGISFMVCLKATTSIWYIDSGRSRHMISKRELFIEVIKKDGGIVTFGDNGNGRV
ncbi:hypothetical protein ACLOJK_034315, partial [Asimina triloba]